MLYLDNSATTPILSQVKEAMLPYLMQEFGNPSSKYYLLALHSDQAVKNARQHIGQLLGCFPDELYFTSGSTESNNMILKGVADYYSSQGNHIITSTVEHPAILETCRFLEHKGYKVTYLEVDSFGRITPEQVDNAITDQTILVSVMWANNEVGSLNDIEKISELCLQHNIFFHTDATQAVGKLNIDLEVLTGITFLSCSGHKFHGPKGIGIAFLRNEQDGIPTKLTPLIHGGGQEGGLRSGTHAVHNIVGMGKAAEIALMNLELNIEKLKALEGKIKSSLKRRFGDKVVFNNDYTQKIPGIISVQFVGINNEILLKKLAPVIAASTGSACSSSKPSTTLKAIGLSIEEIRSTVRFSLSPYIEERELNVFDAL